MRLLVSEGNCSSLLMVKSISILSTPANITAIGNTTICDGNSVSLISNQGNYSYIWKKDNNPITGITQAYYSATQSGVYSVKVTDLSTNCSNESDSIAITVNTTDFNLAFTANPTTFTVQPFNSVFSNQTSNSGNYYWTWNFGDGNNSSQISPNHTYLFDGQYDVELIAQNINTGCYDTLLKNNYISCLGGSANPCNIEASIITNSNTTICPGDSLMLRASQADTNLVYQWIKDGILLNLATDTIYYANQIGMYQLIVSDSSCQVFSTALSVNQYTTLTPIIEVRGSITPCSNDSLILMVNTFFNSYLWSNGLSTPSIYVNLSGNYQVTVTDINGCKTTSLPSIINAYLLQIPEICNVGITDNYQYNRIVWNYPSSNMVDSFMIYRESAITGIYDLIGSKTYAVNSIFTDINSNPNQMTYQYRITAIDTCGVETAVSNYHRTILLNIYAGLGDMWNLSWSNYLGTNFGSFKIYRGADSLNMQLISQVQSSINSYSDLNPPAGNLFYQIEAVLSNSCFPDSNNLNYNNSFSNLVSTNTAPNTGFTQSIDNQLSMLIFPNPNSGNFTLEINSASNKAQDYQLEVYSVMGKLIHQEKLNGGSNIQKQMHFETLSKGVYFIRLRNDNVVLNGHFVVE